MLGRTGHRLGFVEDVIYEQGELIGIVLRPHRFFSESVILPVRTVCLMGDFRTYGEVAAIRAITTDDFMTADWARLPYDVLERMSSRLINEVPGVNRVAFDVTSKPPGTIEWE